MRVQFFPGLQVYEKMEIVKFLKESREELKKVVWPSRDEVVNSTVVVLAAVIVVSIFLYIVDHAFEALFFAVIDLGGK